jgi:hypothetical protein
MAHLVFAGTQANAEKPKSLSRFLWEAIFCSRQLSGHRQKKLS